MDKQASDEGKRDADGKAEASRNSESGFARIVEMRTILPYNNLIGFYYCIIEKSL